MTLETIFGDFEDLPEVAQRTWATSNARSLVAEPPADDTEATQTTELGCTGSQQ